MSYTMKEVTIHAPLYAVYDNAGNLEVAFPTQRQAAEYLAAHQ